MFIVSILAIIFLFLGVVLSNKGWRGEKKTALSLWLSLNKKEYTCFHDLILPSFNGTTQLDHVVVSRFGVFIVETKNKKGWIFGDENQKSWTQVIYRKKYSFQNPLKQVYRQKKVLSEFLGIGESKILPVIYFNGGSDFKTEMPQNVIKNGLGGYIRSQNNVILSDIEVQEAIAKIEEFQKSSKLKLSDHLQSLEQRHNSLITCPRCGGKLLKKVARRGDLAGNEFLGCQNYPRCKFTRSF